MTGIRSVSGLGLVLAVCAASAVAQPPPNPAAGIFPNGMCWNQRVVEVKFNPDLAPELENPGKLVPPFPSHGGANDRLAAMTAAVGTWNQALGLIGSPVKLKLVAANAVPAWAAHQDQPACTDPDYKNVDVYPPDYNPTRDRINAASTAAPTRSGNAGLGAGWVRGPVVESYAIDQRLAETRLIPPINAAALHIKEADILFFTHLNHGRQCPEIQWSYALAPNAAMPGPTPAPYFDYYSVALHELGHLLGLNHQDCAVNAGAKAVNNVMQERIGAGERNSILGCELASLKLLYGPGGRCANPPAAGPARMPAAGSRPAPF